MNNGCRQIERLLLEEAGGAGLTQAQRDLIDAHLAHCAVCRAEAEVALLVCDEGGQGAAPPLDELTERRLLNGIMDQFETVREGEHAPPKKRPRRRFALAAAAVVLALVGAGVGIGVYRTLDRAQTLGGATRLTARLDGARVRLSTGQVRVDDHPVAIGQTVLAGQTVRVRQGRSALALPADSAVMLESDSAVRLDRLSKASTALTLKRGSLLASVRPRPGHPRFTVNTRAGRIEVTGTVFWVESTPDRVVVAVLRGQVRVVEADQPPRLVGSGQRMVLGARALGPDTGTGNSTAPQTRAIGALHQTEAWRWVRALQLLTAPGGSTVRIRSHPAGAQVLVDELLLGETPLTARLSPGHHRLELRKPGYTPVVQWLSVPQGKTLDREVTLRSVFASRGGLRVGKPVVGADDAAGASTSKRGRWRRSRPPWASGEDDIEPPVGAGANSGGSGGDPATPGLVKPKPAASAKELSTRARALRAKGDFKGAVKAFRELLRRYPNHGRAHTARVSLGLVLLDDLKDARAALAQFTRYLAVRRLGALAQEAAYGRIRALRRLGRSAAEIRRLKQFLKQFPQAVHSNAVRRRLRALGVAVAKPPTKQMGLGGHRDVK